MSKGIPKTRSEAAAALPSGVPTPKATSSQSMTRAELARDVHTRGTLGAAYTKSIGQSVGKVFSDVDAERLGMDHARDVLDRMAPRDPAEEMLIAQLLLAHSRVLHLTYFANQQKELASLRTVHEYADRASNTYRRLMLALAEYRRPPKTGDSFTAIKQANIAGQQIVHNNGKTENTNATNEQGCRPLDATAPTPAPALPADAGWVGGPPDFRSPGEAVESIHRTADAERQGPIPNERPAPR